MTTDIKEYSKTEIALSNLKDRFEGLEFHVDTPYGLKQAKCGRAEIRGYRTGLEKMRKEIKAPALDHCRLIDSEAKRITAELVALEDPIDSQIKEMEGLKEAERQEKIAAEMDRVEKIKIRIEKIRSVASEIHYIYTLRIEDIENRIKQIDNTAINDSFDEYKEQASEVKSSTLSFLNDALLAAKERDSNNKRIADDREELAKLRAAEEKRAKKAEEERQEEHKKQREEQDRINMDKKRIEDDRKKLEADQEHERLKNEAKLQSDRNSKQRALDKEKREKFPGIKIITNGISDYFDIDTKVAKKWINELRNK